MQASLVVARGHSCSAACGILVLQLEIEPTPCIARRILTTGPPRESQGFLIFQKTSFIMEIIKHIKVEIRIQGPLTPLLPNFNSYQLKTTSLPCTPCSPLPTQVLGDLEATLMLYQFIHKALV